MGPPGSCQLNEFPSPCELRASQLLRLGEAQGRGRAPRKEAGDHLAKAMRVWPAELEPVLPAAPKEGPEEERSIWPADVV